ncbi:MAG: gamma-glutamyltransferase family protein [Hyphomonas sp.]|nr:gamma-glutamyltransferase family protein [Hyphomonas sp.]
MLKQTMLAGTLALGISACVSIQTQVADAPSVKPEVQALATAPEIVTDPILGPGDRQPSGRALGMRSAVVAPNAAAATAHPLATQTALDIMKQGGTAMDAAIAANAMLGLVEPTGNGIGGDLYAIVWDPKTNQLYGYNGSGRSPMGATLADMQAKADQFMDGEEIPPFGAAPVTVPGTVEAWGALHERFGRLTFNTLMEPTIRYARDGAPIPEVIAYYWQFGPRRFVPAAESGMLEEYNNAKQTYFSPTPVEGSLFRNPDLADTLERIAYAGPEDFYTGEIAQTMGDYFERIGGYLRFEDFAAHDGEWVEPLCVEYRELVKLCELGPNTQGVAALQMLEMLERFDLREMGYGSADSLMAQIEAKRLAFADRAAGYADEAFSGIDPNVFIRPGYNAERGLAIDLNQAMAPPTPGYAEADAKLEEGDTTYLTVTDKDGMMVSLIQSNYRGMGSGLVADGLGFMFQDRGQLFSLDPEHPNVFEPGKRPFHTIIPAFAFKKDMPGCQVRATAPELACPYEPWLSFGLMGGGMQPQGHVQIILNLIDFDMGLQEAGDAARWEHRGGCEPTDDLNGDVCESDMGVVHLESGIPVEARAELERRGHTVECCRANGGGYQAIMRDFESGAWIAATEMRKDGNADGY